MVEETILFSIDICSFTLFLIRQTNWNCGFNLFFIFYSVPNQIDIPKLVYTEFLFYKFKFISSTPKINIVFINF